MDVDVLSRGCQQNNDWMFLLHRECFTGKINLLFHVHVYGHVVPGNYFCQVLLHSSTNWNRKNLMSLGPETFLMEVGSFVETVDWL